MWIPSRETLEKAPKSTVFVLCRWTEFFDRQTPDTYRPRMCHLPRLIEEIGEVAQRAITQASLRKYLRQLKQECQLRIREERDVFKICHVSELDLLIELSLEKTTPIETASKARAITGRGFIEAYELKALLKGRGEIIRNLESTPCCKGASDKWISLWATIAINHSYELCADFAGHDDAQLLRPLDSILDQIIADITKAPEEYLCYVALKANALLHELTPNEGDLPESVNRLKSVLNAAGVALASHYTFKSSDVRPEANELIAKKKIRSSSPTQALNIFILELQPILNIFGFYQSYPPTLPITKGWAGISKKTLISINLDSLKSVSMHPRKETVRLALDGIDAFLSGRLTGAIANALELHHMAISSPDWRVKFTTMWSALESLSSTAPGKSVIARVTNLLVPIVTWRRMDKEIRYLGMSLHQQRLKKETMAPTPNALPNAKAWEVPPDDVLITVSRPKDHPHIVELLQSVSNHPLLLWRVSEIWKLFHNPSALASDFSSSTERLTWHIARIYRARNQLIHHGVESAQARLLLENLHFYLSTAISRILQGAKINPNFSHQQSTDYWRDHAQRVYNMLRTNPDKITVADILLKSRIRAHVSPWAPEVTPI